MGISANIMSTGHRTLPDQSMSMVRTRSDDVLQQAEALPFWSQDYTQLSTGRFSGSVESLATKGIQLFRETMNCSVDEIASAPDNSYVIGVPGRTTGHSHWGTMRIEDHALITLDQNAELIFRTAQDSEISVAVIQADRLEAYGEQILEMDVRSLFRAIRPVERLSEERVDSMQRVFSSLFHDLPPMAMITVTHPAWRYFEDEIINECLSALKSVKPQSQRQPDIRIHRYIVNRVRERTLASPLCPPSIGELCIELNISRRTLNHAFMRVLGVTPVSYIRNIRLNRVRADLLKSTHSDCAISTIAMHWGFWHMSLFSRYYKALFGELPSETRSLRA